MLKAEQTTQPSALNCSAAQLTLLVTVTHIGYRRSQPNNGAGSSGGLSQREHRANIDLLDMRGGGFLDSSVRVLREAI